MARSDGQIMVLVDTSILIERLRGRHNPKADIFDKLIEHGIPIGISVFTYQEVLQGASDEHEYSRLVKHLGRLNMHYPTEGLGMYEHAARLYFDLRRCGVTIRSAFDLLIAITAIEKNMLLLHSDRDFDAIAAARPELKILTELDLEQVPVMTEALLKLMDMSVDQPTRRRAEARAKWLWDEDARLRQSRAEGEAKGRAEGEAKGRADVARAALRKNMPLEIIAELTGLSADEIRSLASF